jgi:hypothetical protein
MPYAPSYLSGASQLRLCHAASKGKSVDVFNIVIVIRIHIFVLVENVAKVCVEQLKEK